MQDLNNKNLGKKTQFMRKAGIISGYMAKKIDCNQAIKRYLYYNTTSPLSSRAKNYDGEIISQPDITHSLIEDDLIQNGIFDEDMQSIKKNQIYIHVFQGDKGFYDDRAEISIAVNVLVDKKFEFLNSNWELRSYHIAEQIEELFDDVLLDELNSSTDIVNELGNIKIELVPNNSFTYTRLSKSNSIVMLSMVFKTSIVPMRLYNG